MALWMAVVLAAAACPPGDGELPRTLQIEDDSSSLEGVVALRAGVWAGREFNFEAVRPDGTKASSKQEAFASASVLGGVQFFDHLLVLGTYEADFASKISVQVGGAYLGWREHPKEKYGKGVPDEVTIYAGVLVGRLEVHQDDFGSFKRDTGFGGGVALGWSLSTQATVKVYGEYRYLKFDYTRDVVSGDTSIGGSTGWFGVGIDYRF